MRTQKIRTLNALVAASLLGLAGTSLAADPVSTNALEPCINGQVSASGLYPTQAEEDAARAAGQRLESAINGQVSASGLYPSQAIEDAVTAAGANALEPAINGQVSSNGLYPSEQAQRQALGS
jgi:DNA-binding transcriptional regulator YdaS (Cro superfamily)